MQLSTFWSGAHCKTNNEMIKRFSCRQLDTATSLANISVVCSNHPQDAPTVSLWGRLEHPTKISAREVAVSSCLQENLFIIPCLQEQLRNQDLYKMNNNISLSYLLDRIWKQATEYTFFLSWIHSWWNLISKPFCKNRQGQAECVVLNLPDIGQTRYSQAVKENAGLKSKDPCCADLLWKQLKENKKPGTNEGEFLTCSLSSHDNIAL